MFDLDARKNGLKTFQLKSARIRYCYKHTHYTSVTNIPAVSSWYSILKVREKQWTGTGAIKRQITLLIPKFNSEIKSQL